MIVRAECGRWAGRRRWHRGTCFCWNIFQQLRTSYASPFSLWWGTATSNIRSHVFTFCPEFRESCLKTPNPDAAIFTLRVDLFRAHEKLGTVVQTWLLQYNNVYCQQCETASRGMYLPELIIEHSTWAGFCDAFILGNKTCMDLPLLNSIFWPLGEYFRENMCPWYVN